jgi:type IV pilus assembly protein PilN
MITVNLLNWREKRRIVHNNRFFFFIGLTVFVTVLVVFMISGVIDELIGSDQSDIAYLTAEINKVESQIEQIKDLQAQKDLLLARRQVIEALQDSRPLVVRIFDNIAHVVPAGVVLNELIRKDNSMTILGTGENNGDVAEFLKNMQKLRWVNNATLSEIKLGAAKAATGAPGSTSTKSTANTAEIQDTKVNFKIEANIISTEADAQAAAAKATAKKQESETAEESSKPGPKKNPGPPATSSPPTTVRGK